MMQHRSLSHAIDEKYFFHHIMSVMIFPEFCKPKIDVPQWWWRTIHGNACEKTSILLYIVMKPYKRIFNWLNTYLLITLFWKNRGFGVLGYCSTPSTLHDFVAVLSLQCSSSSYPHDFVVVVLSCWCSSLVPSLSHSHWYRSSCPSSGVSHSLLVHTSEFERYSAAFGG